MPWTSHATVGWCGGLVGGKPHQPTPHDIASFTAKLSPEFKHMFCIAKLLGLSKWRALAFRAGIHVTIAVMFCWCVMESNNLADRRWTTRNMQLRLLSRSLSLLELRNRLKPSNTKLVTHDLYSHTTSIAVSHSVDQHSQKLAPV